MADQQHYRPHSPPAHLSATEPRVILAIPRRSSTTAKRDIQSSLDEGRSAAVGQAVVGGGRGAIHRQQSSAEGGLEGWSDAEDDDTPGGRARGALKEVDVPDLPLQAQNIYPTPLTSVADLPFTYATTTASASVASSPPPTTTRRLSINGLLNHPTPPANTRRASSASSDTSLTPVPENRPTPPHSKRRASAAFSSSSLTPVPENFVPQDYQDGQGSRLIDASVAMTTVVSLGDEATPSERGSRFGSRFGSRQGESDGEQEEREGAREVMDLIRMMSSRSKEKTSGGFPTTLKNPAERPGSYQQPPTATAQEHALAFPTTQSSAPHVPQPPSPIWSSPSLFLRAGPGCVSSNKVRRTFQLPDIAEPVFCLPLKEYRPNGTTITLHRQLLARDPVINLTLDYLRAPGSLGDSWVGRVQTTGSGPMDAGVTVAVKITVPKAFDLALSPTADSSADSLLAHRYAAYTAKGGSDLALERTLNEAEMYSRHLKRLQGTSIPAFFGMWKGQVKCEGWDREGLWKEEMRDVYVMVLEDAGMPVRGQWMLQIPIEQRIGILQLYRKLHSVGVTKGDCKKQHACSMEFTGPPDYLVSFEKATKHTIPYIGETHRNPFRLEEHMVMKELIVHDSDMKSQRKGKGKVKGA